MIFRKSPGLLFKILSLLVIITFLTSQISWAGRIDRLLQKIEKMEARGVSPERIAEKYTKLQELIAREQEIEERRTAREESRSSEKAEEDTIPLKGPRTGTEDVKTMSGVLAETLESEPPAGPLSSPDITFTFETGAGDTVYYGYENIVRVEKADGTVYDNLVLDGNDDIVSGDITYTDGTVQVIAAGKVSTVTKPGGTIYTYNADEMIESVTYPDATVVTYSYIKDGNNDVIETIITDPEKSSHYDSNNDLVKVVFNDGETVEYSSGFLYRITAADGKVYTYEVVQTGVDECETHLKTIESAGIIYHLEDNNIHTMELPDRSIQNFELDGDRKLYNGTLCYDDGTNVLISQRKVVESINAAGVQTTYQYSPDGLTCDVTIDDNGDISQYTYIKDIDTGKFTVDDGATQYEYDALWNLERFQEAIGSFELNYDLGGEFLGTTLTLVDGTVKEYDTDHNITSTILPGGAVAEYYESGDSAGKVEKAVFPDGSEYYYEYGTLPDGGLKAYRRESYEEFENKTRYYSRISFDHAQNPTLKTRFEMDSSKSTNYLNMRAYGNSPGFIWTQLYLFISSGTPRIYYYYRNYDTAQYENDYRTLDIDIKKDTEYIGEFVWTPSGVDVYIYEASQPRPATPAYSITDSNWNPYFSTEGTNANNVIDPSSTGTYYKYTTIETGPGSSSMKGDPLHDTGFRFESGSEYKYFHHQVRDSNWTSKDALYFTYQSNGTALLRWTYYDEDIHTMVSENIPIDVTLEDDVDYVFRAKLENNDLKLYIFEKGASSPGEAIYILENVTWDIHVSSSMTGGDMGISAYDRMEAYEYDQATGDMLSCVRVAEGETITYNYDGDGNIVTKEIILEDGTIRTYNSEGKIIREEDPTGGVTEYTYDVDGNLISAPMQYPAGTVFTYYAGGEFAGEVETATLPDGKVIYYEYETTGGGNLRAYKRISYPHSNITFTYNPTAYNDYTLNPTVKSYFTLDGSKNLPNANTRAFSYENNKMVDLRVGCTEQGVYIEYSYYDSDTGERISDRASDLDVTINTDTTYVSELVWAPGGVEVYVYESSQPRPAEALYTVAEREWNPAFCVGGVNAGVVLDPASTGVYRKSSNYATDTENPMKESPIHMAEFTFDPAAPGNSKYLSYCVMGSASIFESKSIYFGYSNDTSTMNLAYYNGSGDRVVEPVPISVNFTDGVAYVLLTRIENGDINFYMFEKGTASVTEPGDPVYTFENATWMPNIAANMSGGDFNVVTYDDLDICEFNTPEAPFFDEDVAENMRNKDIFLDGTALQSIAGYMPDADMPLAFPDGNTDIVNDKLFDPDAVTPLPGHMFDLFGNIIPTYDFSGIPYYGIIMYNDSGQVLGITEPDGTVTTYPEPSDVCPITAVNLTGPVTTLPYDGVMGIIDINAYLNGVASEIGGVAYTYHGSGYIESATLSSPDTSGNIYYQYLDEDWGGQGYGRADRSRRETPFNSEWSHRYIYDPDTGVLVEIKAYSDANWTLLLPKTLQDFIDVSLDYFDPAYGTIEPIFGYPHEGYTHKNYTQPTNLGFYAQLLANVISGDIVSEKMSQADAIAALDKMMTSLVNDQATIGFMGLLPWMSFNGSSWQRDGGLYGRQVAFGDNANMSASIGASIGALSDPALAGNTTVQAIKQKMEDFLDAQEAGYNYLYSEAAGLFRWGWNFVDNEWFGGYLTIFNNEFRSGALFVMLRYNFPDSVYSQLNLQMKDYQMQDGSTIFTVAPYDGGAFQMLWPTLTMPEADNPAMNKALTNFVDIALDFSDKRGLPGFVSACYVNKNAYAGNAGIAEIAVNTNPARYEQAASFYTIGAARMVRPAEIDQFLRDIFVEHPDLVTTHGLWEGYNIGLNKVIEEQIVTNVATYVIGLAGKGPEHMTTYLQDKGLYARLQTIYAQCGPSDVVTSAYNAFTWGDGATTSYRSGDEYIFQSPSFHSNGTAFLLSSSNMSGGTLKITYRSTTNVGNCSIDLKQKDPDTGSLYIRLKAYTISFVNTGGVEQEILIDLPTTSALHDIDEVVLTISGGDGGPLDMTITDLDII